MKLPADIAQSFCLARPEPLAIGTAQGLIVMANPAWETFCREVLHLKPGGGGGDFLTRLPEDCRESWRTMIVNACRGEARAFTLRPPSPAGANADNDYRLCFASLPPLRAGDEPCWSLIVTRPKKTASALVADCALIQGVDAEHILAKEIADRQQAEVELQESRERLAQIIHGNSIATFVIDQRHRITHWNKALERLTGIKSAAMIGTSRQWQAFYDHERPTMADLILDQAPEEKIRQFYTDKYIRSQLLEDSFEVEDVFALNGTEKWLLFTAAPIKNGGGAIIGAVETLQDITRRKRMEQEILDYQTILENKVEERTLQLKTTYEQLLHAEKLSAVGKLAASIAHEFGNPIIGIRNFLKGIQKTTPFADDDAELLQLAINECQRVRDLIRNLQNFNRPTSGNMEPLDLHQAINDMLLFCKKSFRERRIVVKKKLAPNLPLINAVHDQIKQVILNCLNNAQEAMPDHGGTISLITEHKEQTVRLHIHDTGKGISESDMVYIFEPFFSTKPAVEGTGLGLSVSYGIMKHHQGKIEVSETSRHGTTFTLTFPAPHPNGKPARRGPARNQGPQNHN